MSTWSDGTLGDITHCRNCGAECVKARSKKGNDYLGVRVAIYGELAGRPIASWYAGHVCDAADVEHHQNVRLPQQQAQNDIDISAGKVVKGQEIIVIAGRKVAKGTIGIVFWVASEPDGYGVTKVGFTTATGDKHFTNIGNTQAVVTEQAAS